MRALIDASSLMLLLKHLDEERVLELAGELAALDLTAYEVGNAVWKEAKLLKAVSEEGARVLHVTLVKLLAKLSVVRVESLDHAEIFGFALAKGVTYYDACYVVAAASLKLPLATEDENLAEAAKGRVSIISWRDLAK